ncbi:hypothetical protein FPCIR_5559 [Fusarium pseudocircinatum]|uniref:WSC domain-containing protein n=1 Tax=Fusarium pseudocircinatum TaxID=56676 RepID=A0A8H5ULL9_9HYPO|nr:hypothetical protein FPCIR_5559 [Fusarium pseudocircinatum]
MGFANPKSLVVFTALPLLSRCFSIMETSSGDAVASAIFNGPGLTIMGHIWVYLVIPEVSTESTASSIISTVLPSTSSEKVTRETTPAPVEPVTSSSPKIPTTSSSDAPPATSSSVSDPSNIDTIRGYTYKGCLGSADGYPRFNLIGSGANMTTLNCVSLARGRAYIGIYDRSCNASDSFDSTSLVLNGRCDNPCPGDNSHFCGCLVVSSSERRWVGPRKALDRLAAPANILLTLYALVDEHPSPSETSTEAEVSITTQDGVTVIPTDSISSRTVATVTDVVAESVILQPVEISLRSSPVPTVEMTTYVMPGSACGHRGESDGTITAPCAAATEPARNAVH